MTLAASPELVARVAKRASDSFAARVIELQRLARTSDDARMLLADAWEDMRPEVARLWRDQLPPSHHNRMRTKIDKLTDAEIARQPEWVEKWTRIGLSTTPADRAMFEAAVCACYRYSGLPMPIITWARNPYECVVAGTWSYLALLEARGSDNVRDNVHDNVRDNVHANVRDNVRDNVSDNWHKYLGGQFLVGGWYYGSPAYVSFFRDVMRYRLPDDLALRAAAYQATCESACWWWPGDGYITVSERPHTIELYPTKKSDPAWKVGALKRVAWEGFEVTR